MSYPVKGPEVQKILADDSTPEGPHLSTAQSVAYNYLWAEI